MSSELGQQYTKLVGVKWTKQRMLKIHDMLLNKYIDEMVNKTIGMSDHEKIKRITISYNWIKRIRDLCNNNDIAFKKEEKKK